MANLLLDDPFLLPAQDYTTTTKSFGVLKT